MADGQAKPRPALANPGLGLAEGLEDLRQAIGRDAGAGVPDLAFHVEQHVLALAGERDLDAAAVGEFQGVADQIVEDLLDANRVPQGPLVLQPLIGQGEADPLGVGAGGPEGRHIVQQAGQMEGLLIQVQPASLGA